jgi:UDP-N-acetyl-2-amino-2-deoxyglucuronate dehydrogenase
LVGAAGYIAPRHFRAIRDTGNVLVAAVDPHDAVGGMDAYFPEARFFTEIERFDRHIEKLRRLPDQQAVNYVSICSPNYLHDAHIRLALRAHAHAICEKPLVINPWNLDALAGLEAEYNRRIYTILQLRVHPALVALKKQLEASPRRDKAEISLTYITRRGAWYAVSWKGDEARSGGVAMNIGIHFFDLLIWLFGSVEHSEVHLRRADKMAGRLELQRANVRWFLSLDGGDLPAAAAGKGQTAYRSLQIDGQNVEFSEGFTDLHTRVYEEILAGRGYGMADARDAIQAVYDIRKAEVVTPRGNGHPLLAGG